MKANSILELIGNTPLLKINRMNQTDTVIYAKVESFNPAGSTKDRAALFMIEEAEKKGVLAPGAVIVEPTSGNTGIGLALISAIKGYHLILTMPDTMSIERRKLLAAYGAELVLTPGKDGMSGAIAKAEEILQNTPGSFMPQQFKNPANPYAHYATTGPEIWHDTEGKIDVLVAGVGTGGTLTGIARYLKEQNPEIKVVAVEPADSAVLSGKAAAPHKLQGIGADFIPDTLDKDLIDLVFPVGHEDAGNTAREAVTQEGLLIGISGGAALFAALEIGKKPEFSGKNIVVILPDSGERYLSSWLFSC